jgi:hypothetical protein
MLPVAVSAAAQFLGSMMSGKDAAPSGPTVSGQTLNQAFHADGWVVATGNADSKGGKTGSKDMRADGGPQDASGAGASFDAGGLMPLALALGAALIGAAIFRAKR